MTFSTDSISNNKTPWVEVHVPNSGRDKAERERLLAREQTNNHLEEPAAEAVIFIDHGDNRAADGALQHEPEGREGLVVPEEEEHSEYPKAMVTASATAGGILGCLLGGIGCAFISALGFAYAAKNKGGTCVGDCARAMGEVAVVAREKAVALDEKHHILNTSHEAAGQTAREMDRQYSICERSKNAIVYTSKAAMDFSARHRLMERSVEGVGRGLEYVGGARISSTSNIASESPECNAVNGKQ